MPDCGQYWDTFDLNIRKHLNAPIIIYNRLAQMLEFIINAETKEGRGPHKGDSVLSQAAIKAIKRAMTRAADFKPYPPGFVEHRQVPGKKTLEYLPIWRVNGRGSLGCERVHAVMNTLVTKNMSSVTGALSLLEGVAKYNADIRETLEIGYGCPGLYDWWMAEEAHSLALELNGEHRYQLRLPSSDNGETFFVAGLTDFRRPDLVRSEEVMKKKSDIYKRNAEERLAKREDLLEKKRIRSRQSRAAANGLDAGGPSPATPDVTLALSSGVAGLDTREPLAAVPPLSPASLSSAIGDAPSPIPSPAATVAPSLTWAPTSGVVVDAPFAHSLPPSPP
ncbi:hypothetical protein CYMTET_45031 [Cymbomonas tetramitiformis]|uniref:Uncharacterized protein n=1 Tax=Cymbomonas tetramitiformis TaxID=36881 RepID=A0AAE0C140_9CHLO|nr:hypothetical protein CYMTET_45031 [Cymbomonas tetramitiformis]